MKTGNWMLFISGIILICACFRIEGLRCRSEESLNGDEMKRIARTCMRSIGHRDSDSSDSDNSDSGNDDSDGGSDSNDDIGDDYPAGRNRNEYNNRGRTRQRYDYRRFRDTGISRYGPFERQQAWGNDNLNNKQGQQSHQNRRNRPDQNYTTNSTEQDRNCLMHCFFREMKMTNSADYPDKHKVVNVLAKDIRERELRDFYTDSIQQCFHMVELTNNRHKRKDKCEFTQNIVTCLSERAKANCEDFADEMHMF